MERSYTHHKSWGHTALCHQPRAKRVGRTPNTWITKKGLSDFRGGSGGTTRKTLPWATLLLEAINASVCSICRRQIAVYSHICVCALKGARHWRAGLDFFFLSLWLHRREEHESNPNVSPYGFQMEKFAEICASTYCTHASWRVCLPVLCNIGEAESSDWTVTDFGGAASCVQVQMRNCEDDVGLTAEVWTCSFQQNSGNICCLCTNSCFITARTIFNMLPKHMRPIQVIDFSTGGKHPFVVHGTRMSCLGENRTSTW